MPTAPSLSRSATRLRKAALAYPETWEDHPWGKSAFKVKGKVFLFLSTDGTTLSLSMKLPRSSGFALLMPFAKPTGYGLGRSGWVTASFGTGEPVPLPLLLDWLEESFCAVAPKRLSASLGGKPDPGPTRGRR